MSVPSDLFSPLTIRGLDFPNRIATSPMCQYSSRDGFANDWHLVHLGSRAVGGAGLVFVEATAVSPEGRITPADMGLWKDDHVENLRRIVDFVHSQGCRIGIQLAHAGRKAGMRKPWESVSPAPAEEGGWSNVVAPSAVAFAENYLVPTELDGAGMAKIVADFGRASQRAAQAGFDVIEIHAAHGYLLHEFLSPLSNFRRDEYGGAFENRTRMIGDVVRKVRNSWAGPLFVRISATDWVEGGWDIGESVELARLLKEEDVDLIDVSSGGLAFQARIPAGPGYQIPFAARIRREACIPTAAVGMITDAAQADRIVRNGDADLVLLAREMLRDPYWPLHSAARLGNRASWPVQYLRAAAPGSPARAEIAVPKSAKIY
jgi:2,4-dienoyl-CoA reductase-like NADH-dependent reductase (Old Yellow Enzyme family)